MRYNFTGNTNLKRKHSCMEYCDAFHPNGLWWMSGNTYGSYIDNLRFQVVIEDTRYMRKML